MIDLKWFAPDGLMRLDPLDARQAFPGAQFPTVGNQNGILFAAIYNLLKYEVGETLDGKDFVESLVLVEDPKNSGFILRHPFDFENDEAQDNYAAVYAGCTLYGVRTAPQRIHEGAIERGFNQDSKGSWSTRYLRQGGDIACCELACGWPPILWFWIWFLAGIIFNAFAGKPVNHNHVSDAQLALVRLLGVQHCIRRYNLPKWVTISFYPVFWFWSYRTKSKYGSIWQPTATYFTHPEHPNKELALRAMKMK